MTSRGNMIGRWQRHSSTEVPSTRYQAHRLPAQNPELGTRNAEPETRPGRRPAFTLMELLIVVVIALILMAVTLPTVKYSLEEGKLREGARQFNAMFATAKSQATASGRPAGVWLELERIGDPNPALVPALYQCSQLYLAEVPLPYSGDVLGAKCFASIPPLPMVPDASELNMWPLQVLNSSGQPVPFLVNNPSAASIFTLNERFAIRFDFKGDLYQGETRNIGGTDDDGDGSTDEQGEFGFYLYGRGGVDQKYGRANVDDNNNGSVDQDLFGPDRGEYGWKGSDDIVFLPPAAANTSGGYAFQIYRQPQRAGQPLELPQGIVIDMPYSGIGPTGYQFEAAKEHVLVLFSPNGSVASVSFVHQIPGQQSPPDVGNNKIFFLVGKTEKMEFAWNVNNFNQSNITDGSNLWVVVNRRNGSIATVENTPDATAPLSNPITPQERANFLTLSREFARTGEVKGGQ